MIIKTFLHQKAIFTSQGEVRASEMDLKKKKKKSKIKAGARCQAKGLGGGLKSVSSRSTAPHRCYLITSCFPL